MFPNRYGMCLNALSLSEMVAPKKCDYSSESHTSPGFVQKAAGRLIQVWLSKHFPVLDWPLYDCWPNAKPHRGIEDYPFCHPQIPEPTHPCIQRRAQPNISRYVPKLCLSTVMSEVVAAKACSPPLTNCIGHREKNTSHCCGRFIHL
jgi:hypothetical protein